MKADNKHVWLVCIWGLLMGVGLPDTQAQQLEIEINYLQGVRYTAEWDLFRGGTELSLAYLLSRNPWTYRGGINARTVQWGTQVTASLGITRKIDGKLELGAGIQNGIALFRKTPLYVFGGGINSQYVLLQKKKIHLGLSLGVRYSVCPAYKRYSLIYSLIEIPVGVFIRV